MWPFNSYPELSPSQVDGKEYDYIIVGGGTAGCCLASRLSEDPDVTVLVIEKGHAKDNFVSRVPLISQNFWMGDPLQVQSDRWTEPLPGAAAGRTNRYWTAEGLGGASRINAMLYTRGIPACYDEWATRFGLTDWAWPCVEPSFKKVENTIAHPNASHRGHSGPMAISQPPQALEWPTYTQKIAENLQLPVQRDCNNPTGAAMGLFFLDMTIDGSGRRASAFSSFLNKSVATSRRDRLSICAGAVVSHVELNEQGTQAQLVHIKAAAARSGSGDTAVVKVRREVIICAGTVCSPGILMRSGIGPVDQLRRHGISLRKDLPVGKHLQDHIGTAVMVEPPKSQTLGVLESAWAIWHLLLWVFFGTGLMGVSSTPQSIFVRTSAIDDNMVPDTRLGNLDATKVDNIPDLEIMLQPVNSLERGGAGRHFFSFFPALLRPHSTGQIELSSEKPLDPMAHPRILHPFLGDERDVAKVRRGVRFAMRLADDFEKSGFPYPAPLVFAPGMDKKVLEDWESTPGVPPKGLTFGVDGGETETKEPVPEVVAQALGQKYVPKTWRTVTDDEIDDYVRRVAMVLMHATSTCRMSKEDDGTGVVDQQLRVHGISNLRIADASVFPVVPSCHTMAPTIMVAERCAEFIKQTWRKN
ncbi:hypothetical protein B0I35DRAFT_443386 [Stachybotrys elegans]|uniref:Glucose-methanol-choline oxidoreductase N-terminal domain-containing protein n=1 Tax=Stachybotrys elegans TaxID=80388 RepID=A0A8K0WKH1_9HYPO|nr:hypothetical protein B0I35DRAFT_443386 [Stachybotrys elegans]